jgi:hypothetical protein
LRPRREEHDNAAFAATSNNAKTDVREAPVDEGHAVAWALSQSLKSAIDGRSARHRFAKVTCA